MSAEEWPVGRGEEGGTPCRNAPIVWPKLLHCPFLAVSVPYNRGRKYVEKRRTRGQTSPVTAMACIVHAAQPKWLTSARKKLPPHRYCRLRRPGRGPRCKVVTLLTSPHRNEHSNEGCSGRTSYAIVIRACRCAPPQTGSLWSQALSPAASRVRRTFGRSPSYSVHERQRPRCRYHLPLVPRQPPPGLSHAARPPSRTMRHQPRGNRRPRRGRRPTSGNGFG